jgi:hypothetical protein
MSFLFAGSVGSSPNFIGKDELAAALRELSQPSPQGDRVKQAINRAAKLCGLDYWRAFDIWYRKARRIDAHEAAQINEALRIKREKAVANEYHDLKARLAKLESMLLIQDNPNIHRKTSDPAGFGVRRAR